jgi:ferritin
MQDAMNEQINKEFFSSYLYLSMAAYFEERNLSGFAHWMRMQADEERGHAMSASIYSLYELAMQEKDYPAQTMLQWFINEQVEEEKNAAEIVANLKLIEERGTAVLMLDKQLGKRKDE